jgi:hypothetical protein
MRPIGEKEALTSCHCCSRKVHAFTKKELETTRETQKLLGAPTIVRGSAEAGGGGVGSLGRQISPYAGQNTQKRLQKRTVSYTY